MKIFFCFVNLMLVFSSTFCSESVSQKDLAYRKICLQASRKPCVFHNFRSHPDYSRIVEAEGYGKFFADFLLKVGSKEVLEKLEMIRRLDTIGHPLTEFFPGLGVFSGTTLRYIVILEEIRKFFSLPENSKIVEIGAGFGGQCFVLSQFISFSNYYIYDLPEVQQLIKKVIQKLQVPNVVFLPLEYSLGEEVDLVISNYAFSECNKPTQLDYFEKVIKKAKRGYMLYNQISERSFPNNYLSPSDFVSLLEENGIHARIFPESVPTHPNNVLIVWDRTR